MKARSRIEICVIFCCRFILYEIEHIVSNTGIKLKQCENRNIIMAKKGKSEVA